MTKKVEKLIRNYWSISKIIAVVFTICNYSMWTEPFSFIKAILILVLGLVATFITINALDMIVGVIVSICKRVHRHFYDKRLLKAFCGQKEDEV
ncbi:MAG TPA: hypothetical protein DCM21_10480 [Butyrivibrio sp.]|nr:hypothetical protein [Butyrivibrio sp.]